MFVRSALRYSEAEARAAIAASQSFAEALRRLGMCASGGNWRTASGNGYFGGLQFSPRTWKAFGGQGMPHRASRGQQIAVAERVLAKQGWKAWPVCSRKAGYRR